MTRPITTLEEMRACLDECTELIRAIPHDQRTLALKSLLNDLRLALSRYDDIKREEEK